MKIYVIKETYENYEWIWCGDDETCITVTSTQLIVAFSLKVDAEIYIKNNSKKFNEYEIVEVELDKG